MRPDVRAVLLDVDGTLYDQRRLRRLMALRILAALARDPVRTTASIRFLRVYRSTHEALRGSAEPCDVAAVQLRTACDATRIELESGKAILAHWFEAEPLRLLPRVIRPGLLDFLEGCRRAGVRLGIVSDYPARSKLKALGLGSFDAVVSCGDPEVGRLKPDPCGVTTCLAQLGVPPQAAVYVGDRADVDAECGRRAGVTPILIGDRPHPGVARVRTFSELQGLLEGP